MPEIQLSEQWLEDFKGIFDRIAPLILPDFYIEGSMPPGHCTRVDYKVTMSPGVMLAAIDGTSTDQVEVAVDCRDHKNRLVGRHIWFFPQDGGERHGSFQWPIPADSGPWDPDWTATATLTVNPSGNDHIAERSMANNTITVSGTCVG